MPKKRAAAGVATMAVRAPSCQPFKRSGSCVGFKAAGQSGPALRVVEPQADQRLRPERRAELEERIVMPPEIQEFTVQMFAVARRKDRLA